MGTSVSQRRRWVRPRVGRWRPMCLDVGQMDVALKYRLSLFADVPVEYELPRVAYVFVEKGFDLFEDLAETMVAAAIPLRECVGA